MMLLMGKQKCYNTGLSVEVLAYELLNQKASTLPFIRSISFQPSNGSYLEEYIPLGSSLHTWHHADSQYCI